MTPPWWLHRIALAVTGASVVAGTIAFAVAGTAGLRTVGWVVILLMYLGLFGASVGRDIRRFRRWLARRRPVDPRDRERRRRAREHRRRARAEAMRRYAAVTRGPARSQDDD